jgi:hypothetical protein
MRASLRWASLRASDQRRRTFAIQSLSEPRHDPAAYWFMSGGFGGEFVVEAVLPVAFISLRLFRMRTAVWLVMGFWWLVCWCLCDGTISAGGEYSFFQFFGPIPK